MEKFKKYYVYQHIRKDTNEVFYVGIGTINTKANGFYNMHGRTYSKTRNIFWKRIVSKTEYEVEIIYRSDNYDEVLVKEVELISEFGRRDKKKGTLCNLTDGGEGALNPIITEESRIRRSELGKKAYAEGKCAFNNPEYYEKMSIFLKGNQYAKGQKRTKEQLVKLYEGRMEKISKRVIQEDLEGKFIKEWYSTCEVAEYFGITYKAVWNACSKYNIGATSCGFRWYFKEN